MTYLLVLLFYILPHPNSAHDVPLSLFHIYEDSEIVNIDITFDTEDLLHILQLSEDQLSSSILEQFLRKETTWEFDECRKQIKVLSLTKVGDHILIEGSFEEHFAQIKKLKIYNQCFDSVLNHSNIIQLDLRGKNADFRMHVKRKQIEISF